MSLASEERKTIILSLLNEQGRVIASDLAKRFEVSTETVRRDLDDLEKESKLKKVYGGAVKVKVEVEPTLFERSTIYLEAKEKIGYLASTLIEDRDVIFIDEGTTALQIIPHLIHKNHVKVITSSISALLALMDLQKKEQFNGTIMILGGEVSTKHLRVTGSMAESNMKDIFVNKAFLTVDGISLKKGFTSYDHEKSSLTRKWMSQSNTTIIIADSSKWNKISMVRIGDFKDADIIVSEKAPPEEWLAESARYQVDWLLPKEE